MSCVERVILVCNLSGHNKIPEDTIFSNEEFIYGLFSFLIIFNRQKNFFYLSSG